MEMWHGGVSKYKPTDSVSVYVGREVKTGWGTEKKGKRKKPKREKNIRMKEIRSRRPQEDNRQRQMKREVQHYPQHF